MEMIAEKDANQKTCKQWQAKLEKMQLIANKVNLQILKRPYG